MQLKLFKGLIRNLLNWKHSNIVSPSGSLQDVSPPVTPVITVSQSGSPAVAASPVITTRSPITLTQHSPAAIHNQSPVLQNAQKLLAVPRRTSTSTPPPPPPPISLHISPVHTTAQVWHAAASPKSSVRVSLDGSSTQKENKTFNGLHGFSQSQLHPLQQATLLQQVRNCLLVCGLYRFGSTVKKCMDCWIILAFN